MSTNPVSHNFSVGTSFFFLNKRINRANKLIKKSGSVVGSELVTLFEGGGGQDAGKAAGNHGQCLSLPPQSSEQV